MTAASWISDSAVAASLITEPFTGAAGAPAVATRPMPAAVNVAIRTLRIVVLLNLDVAP